MVKSLENTGYVKQVHNIQITLNSLKSISVVQCECKSSVSVPAMFGTRGHAVVVLPSV